MSDQCLWYSAYVLYAIIGIVVFVLAARKMYKAGCKCDECRVNAVGLGLFFGAFWPVTVLLVAGVALIVLLEYVVLPRG